MGLKAWYRFEGDVLDSSGNGLHGTNNNATLDGIGKIGSAANFPNGFFGSTSFSASINLTYPSIQTPRDTLSISCWVKYNTSSVGFLVSVGVQNSSFGIERDGNNIRVGIRTSTAEIITISTPDLNDNIWHHIVVILSQESVSLYVDGNLINTVTNNTTGGFSPNHPNFIIHSIGRIAGSTNDSTPYEGLLDDLRFYDHVLSPKEIRELYKAKIFHLTVSAPQYGFGYSNSGIGEDLLFFDGTPPMDVSDFNQMPILINGSNFSNTRNVPVGFTAMNFGGSTFLTIPHNDELNMTGDFTASFWFYLRDYLPDSWSKSVFRKAVNDVDNEFLLRIRREDTAQFYYGNGLNAKVLTFNPSQVFPLNQWLYVTCVRRIGQYLKIYVNGVEAASRVTSDTPQAVATTSDLRIMGVSQSSSGSVDGILSDFRLYSYAFTQNDVDNMYKQRMVLDSHGNLYSYGFEELLINSKVITPNGILAAFEISEVGIVDEMMSWHPLNGNSDDIYSGWNATTEIDVEWLPGKLNRSAFFNGTSSDLRYGEWDYPATWSNEFSISTWINVPASATWTNGFRGNIITRGSYSGSHGLIRWTNNNEIAGWIRGSTASSQARTMIVRDEWQHCVMTWDGDRIRIYVNGEFRNNSSSFSPGGTPDEGNIHIGSVIGLSGSSGNRFNGYMNNFRFFKKALTLQEINILYDVENNGINKMKHDINKVFISGSYNEII